MEIYSKCEYCPLIGEVERVKMIPFGNELGSILFVLPDFYRPDEDEKNMLMRYYPEAYFVGFVACYNVENKVNAELSCGILLRNTAKFWRKILAPDTPAIRHIFKIKDTHTLKDTGVAIVLFKDKPLMLSVQGEYERLKNG